MSIIYPPNKHTSSSKTIFFIGHADEYCKINGQEIELVFAGNFCPVFDLQLGENLFEIDLDGKLYNYQVERVEAEMQNASYKFKPYQGKEVTNYIKKICLDAGHGASQLGTCSPKAIYEKDLNLSLVHLLKLELEKHGFETYLTRDADEELSLEKRVAISMENNADLFLSIHHNAIPDHLNPLDEHGISAHYYYEHSKVLAAKLSSFLAQKLDMKDCGAVQQNLYVTRENQNSKAILLECGYLIHPYESEKIVNPEFQKELAFNLTQFLLSLNKKIKN